MIYSSHFINYNMIKTRQDIMCIIQWKPEIMSSKLESGSITIVLLIHTKWLSTLKQFLGHFRLFELNECFWCSISYQQLNLIFIWTAFGLILWKIDLQIVKILSKYAFDYHLWWRYCWQLRGTAEILGWSKYNILNFFRLSLFRFQMLLWSYLP